jgi:glycosyltransferase involved in cell wall biosynthesis
MASGLPVVLCDPNLVEVVGRKAGLLCKPDAKSFSRSIERLAGNGSLRQAMSKAGIAQSRQFDYQDVAKRLEQIYQALLSGRVGTDKSVL